MAQVSKTRKRKTIFSYTGTTERPLRPPVHRCMPGASVEPWTWTRDLPTSKPWPVLPFWLPLSFPLPAASRIGPTMVIKTSTRSM